MKKIFSFVLIIFLITGVFAACGGQNNGPVEPAGVVPEYSRGVTTSAGWSSEWLNISYSLNDGFTFATEEQIEEMMQISADAILVDGNGNPIVDYSKVDAIYEMMAYGTDGSNVIVCCEKNKTNLSPKAYIDAVKIQLERAGMEYSFSGLTDYAIGGKAMKRTDATTDVYGPTMYQTYLLMPYGDRMVSIIVSSTDRAMIETMLDAFK